MPLLFRNTFVVASLAAAALLSGCALSKSGTASDPVTVMGSQFKGSVHGGQQPVSGASLQLYAAGNTGYGSSYAYASGTSLLGANAVFTDAAGNFSITGTYTCPSASTPVWIVATGGNPGLGSGRQNANLAMMAALGPCGNLSSSTYISINELTTVASVWALSGFMSGPAAIGTSGTNATGLTNAFASVNKVVNTTTGAVSGPTLPPGATLPLAKINTLADMLAACINSAGGTAGDGSTCGKLFTAASVGSAAPADTITAALNIAQHPTTQVAALSGLVTPAAPFQPTLAGTPNDLSIVISYTGGGLSSPSGVAVDSSGNVWATNAGSSSVTETDNSGAVLSGTSGYSVGGINTPVAIAIDPSGNAWVANAANNTVTQIVAGGVSGTAYGIGSTPASIAIDGFGTVFTANTGGSLSRITQTGYVTSTTVSGATAPLGLAVNPK